MTTEGQGSVYQARNKIYIYVPLLVSSDSMFPFKKGEKVLVKILNSTEIAIRKNYSDQQKTPRKPKGNVST